MVWYGVVWCGLYMVWYRGVWCGLSMVSTPLQWPQAALATIDQDSSCGVRMIICITPQTCTRRSRITQLAKQPQLQHMVFVGLVKQYWNGDSVFVFLLLEDPGEARGC